MPRVFLGTNPAAGIEVSETVPAGKAWLIRAVTVQLVQGATQTPQPILVIDDGVNVVYESFGSSAAQAVSTTTRYCWAPDLALSGQVGVTTTVHSSAPLPNDFVAYSGWRLRTVTLGIGANSDYSVPTITVVEFG